MKEPSFFVIGKAKCGTTSMYSWLRDHPKIYMPPQKELRFFSKDLNIGNVENFGEYLDFFSEAKDRHEAVGEASAEYMYSKRAVGLIENIFPGSKYIVMLRHPIEMLISLHDHLLWSGVEEIESFEAAWRLSPLRRRGINVPDLCNDGKELDYMKRGQIKRDVVRLHQKVPNCRIKIVTLRGVKNKPQIVYKEVLDFLGVEYLGRDDYSAKNKSKKERISGVKRITRKVSEFWAPIKKWIGLGPSFSLGIIESINIINAYSDSRKKSISKKFRRELRQFYEKDIHFYRKKASKC